MPSITDAAFESFVNVHKFYARGDGTTDDTAAIQDCIDNSEGPIYFPPGSYKLSGPLTIQGQRSYLGAGGNGVSALVQTSASDPILTWPASTAIEYATVEGLTFQANVSGGAKGIVAPSGGSAVKLDVRRCWFWRELLECINTPMIYGNIEHNFFGGYGATSYAQHQHIQCLGNGGSNFNYVAHNRFYNATGNESCVFDWGFHLVLLHNNWEQNGATTTLRLKGLTTVDLSSNWFEDNDGVYQVISEVGSGGSTGNKIITSHNNWWNPNGTSNQYLFKTAFSAGRVHFGYEAGTNFGSIEIVDDNDWYAFKQTGDCWLTGYTGSQVSVNVAPPIAAFTVADLPTLWTTGFVAFATNGRKTGEGAGLGTGVLAYYDGTAWRRVDDGTTVVA